CARQAPPEDYW
nr:immunoglobulin heavy chain junction region [Mus musculus]